MYLHTHNVNCTINVHFTDTHEIQFYKSVFERNQSNNQSSAMKRDLSEIMEKLKTKCERAYYGDSIFFHFIETRVMLLKSMHIIRTH